MAHDRAGGGIQLVRAAAWELAALSFRYPDEALVQAVASGEWAAAAREAAEGLGAGLPEGFGAGLSGAAPLDARALRIEATRLFVGAPEPAASPFEGVWRAADDGAPALLFVNPHAMDVERFMRACGLGRPKGTNDPLDRIDTECELLEHLALRSAGVRPPDGAPADAALPGGSPEAAYGAFLAEHARAWMPRFARRVADEAREPFYREAAVYLGALVAAG